MQVFQNLTKGIRFNKSPFQNEKKLLNNTTQSTGPKHSDQLSTIVDPPSSALKRKNDSDSDDDEVTPFEESVHSHLKSSKDVLAFRKLNQIKVSGNSVPAPSTSFYEIFHSADFPPYLPESIKKAGYLVPTPIQLQTIPILLKNRDVLSCAPTGSGKTLAYLIPLIHLVRQPSLDGISAIILCPTKDLAHQIERELKKLVSKKWKVVVFSNEAQCNEHTHCDILISTPTKLAHSVEKNRINLSNLKIIVLDECDKLLEKPGSDNVLTILKACPKTKRIGMFSATLPGSIEVFAKSILRSDFVRVIVGHKNTVTTNIEQSLVFVGDEPGKRTTLRQQLRSGELKAPILIFVQNVVRARSLYEEFSEFPIEYIHAERSDHQREKVLQSFRAGQNFILVGTDLLARGMDLVVNTVINFDFPTSTETYIHRIGRTGRAGRPGKAVTYFTVEDGKYLRCVVNIMKESGCEVPEWLLTLKTPSQKARKMLKYAPPKRKKFYIEPKAEESENIVADNTAM